MPPSSVAPKPVSDLPWAKKFCCFFTAFGSAPEIIFEYWTWLMAKPAKGPQSQLFALIPKPFDE